MTRREQFDPSVSVTGNAARFRVRVISTEGPARPGWNGEISSGAGGAVGRGGDPSTALRFAQDDTGAGAAGGNRGGQSGFTLIELLVVIGVIAVLMAILFPCLRRARKAARSTVCRANLKHYGLGFQAYVNDHDGRMFGPPGNKEGFWHQLIPYMNKTYRSDYEGGEDFAAPLGCPEETILEGKVMTQGWGYRDSPHDLNYWLIDPPPGHPSERDGSDRHFWRTVDAARRPYDVPVVMDIATWGAAFPDHDDRPPPQDLREPLRPNSGGNIGCMRHFCIPRHGDYVNGLFLDWSVRPVGLKELWTLKWHRQYNTSGPWTKAGGVQPEDWPQWMRQFRDY